MNMHKMMLLITVFAGVLSGNWGIPPENWGDFQIGLNSRPGAPSANEMKSALAAGKKLDRRYVYANSPAEIFPDGANAFLFTSWRNYAKEAGYYDKGVRPCFTVYMLQRGQDGLEAVKNGAADQAFMKEYFEAMLVMLDSAKGTQPVYVLEPDVWGYLLQGYESTLGEKNLNSTCHLNNLGFNWLSEFENKIRDLPKAIIKTIKMRDPEAYSGILLAHWAYNPTGWGELVNFTPDQINTAAEKGAEFIDKLLGDTYNGDFIGVEKNGAAAGWYEVAQGTTKWYWNDAQNANWLDWSIKMAKALDLSLLGWQISAGYYNESGYSALPNTSNRYKDTFFPYFFKHVTDFIQAGFIGLMLGSEDRGVGTICTKDNGKYDNGYFHDQMAEFDKDRPYNLTITTGIQVTDEMAAPQYNGNISCIYNSSRKQIVLGIRMFPGHSLVTVLLFSPSGREEKVLYHGRAQSHLVLPVSTLSHANGIYFVKVIYGTREKAVAVPLIE